MMKGRVSILGGGETGCGVAQLAKTLGYEVYVSDNGKIGIHYQEKMKKANISFEENNHDMDKILSSEFVVKSPGIPNNVNLIKKIKRSKIPILSEIEFVFPYCKGIIIAVTGSNGKTTTVSLIYHMLKQAGKDVSLVGNVGTSFAQQVNAHPTDYYVLELSSFQLENCIHFKPHISVITNFSSDHLDRYESYQEYINTKMNIISNQTSEDTLVYFGEDNELVEKVRKSDSKVTKISFGFKNKTEVYYENESIIMNYKNTEVMISTVEYNLIGRHNMLNAMAAVTVSKLLNINNESIRKSLSSFTGVEHRMEKVLKIHDVTYINDSKATNVNSVMYALESIKQPIVWIAGGVDKGNDYSSLMPLVREKVKSIICLGIDNKSIIDTYSPVIDSIIEVRSMAEAVSKAYEIANSFETVLLSPACASFDLFKNYEDRGTQFKQNVKKL